MLFDISKHLLTSYSKIAFVMPEIYSSFGIPTKSFTFCSVILLSSPCEHLSRIDKASLIAPSESSAIRFKASSEYSILHSLQTFSKFLVMSGSEIFLKSNLWHLERIVAGNFCGSVVASINLTCFGGSSSVLSRALNAPGESI